MSIMFVSPSDHPGPFPGATCDECIDGDHTPCISRAGIELIEPHPRGSGTWWRHCDCAELGHPYQEGAT